jgi:mitochondrial Rho GTPase 1
MLFCFAAEKVGKTTIIEVLITNRFEEFVQPVLPVVVVPEDATPERVHVSIVDTPGGAAGMPKVDEGLASANVVVLVYSVDDDKSIQRVRTFWLEKFRSMKLNVPIVLVGNKIDLRGGVDSPNATENMEEFIKPIMDEYREVEVCIECSAKTVSNIPEVFYFAQKAVLHPTGPLYNVDTQSLTDGAAAALRRVFSICDRDKDGALNDKELNEFQFQCFSIHLAPDELEGVKKVVKENRPSNGLTPEGYLSVEGFLFLHMLFVQKGRLETTWIVLRKFGYNDDLRLELDAKDKLTKADDQSVEFTPAALAFLEDRFKAADTDKDNLLSPDDIAAIFANCPDGVFPSPRASAVSAAADSLEASGKANGGDKLQATRQHLPNLETAQVTNGHGGSQACPERLAGPPPDDSSKSDHMTFEAFIARWSLMVMDSPEHVMLTLMYIGYTDPPLSALKTTKPRKRDRYNRTVSRNIFYAVVLGDPENSCADIVRGVTGIGGSMKGLASAGVAAASLMEVDKEFGGGKRTLVMRDIPATGLKALFGSKRELEACDVMCIVFNSASMESFEQAVRIHNAVLAKSEIVKVPVVFVAVRAEAGAEDVLSVVEAGDAYCEQHNLASPVRVSPGDSDFGSLYRDLVGVALHPQLACPDYYDSEPAGNPSTLSTVVKIAAAAALVGTTVFLCKRAYDYYTTKQTS